MGLRSCYSVRRIGTSWLASRIFKWRVGAGKWYSQAESGM